MNHQLTPRISKRVADYFVVVGPGDQLVPLLPDDQRREYKRNPLKMFYNASITDRYPITDHSDNHFPEGLTLFCFPNGVEICTEPSNPLFYSFVNTSEYGAHMMGCCLIFYEPLNLNQLASLKKIVKEYEGPEAADRLTLSQYFIPRCLCIVSNWPFILSFKKILCQFYRYSLTPSSIPIERYICNFIDDVPAPPAVLVDITYYFGDQAVTFRCPPANQPNVWSGVPMSPLFECFDPDTILQLLSAVLVNIPNPPLVTLRYNFIQLSHSTPTLRRSARSYSSPLNIPCSPLAPKSSPPSSTP